MEVNNKIIYHNHVISCSIRGRLQIMFVHRGGGLPWGNFIQTILGGQKSRKYANVICVRPLTLFLFDTNTAVHLYFLLWVEGIPK